MKRLLKQKWSVTAIAFVAAAAMVYAVTTFANAEETVRGELNEFEADDGRPSKYSITKPDGSEVPVKVKDKKLKLESGSEVEITGKKEKGGITVAANKKNGKQKQKVITKRFNRTTGEKKVAVILTNFSNDKSEPFTPDQVRDKVFTGSDSANAYFKEASYGKMSLTGRNNPVGDVYGYYTIKKKDKGCLFSFKNDKRIKTYTREVRKAVKDSGVNLDGYDHTIYVMPRNSKCKRSDGQPLHGSADLNRSQSWIYGYNLPFIYVHEIGHNLGVHHATSMSCKENGKKTAFPFDYEKCKITEYGDPFDIMGGRKDFDHLPHFNAERKVKFGWISRNNAQTVTKDGVYTLRPVEAKSNDIQSLRLPWYRDETGEILDYLYLEYRDGTGFDSYLAGKKVTNGVTARIDGDFDDLLYSFLMDASPRTKDVFDAPIGNGKQITDKITGTVIKVEDVRDGRATVRISGYRHP